MLINERILRIEWGDCDPAGIVFYPRYFAMFDASTHALFRAAGLTGRDMLDRYGVVGIPMVDTRARFLAPSRPGDEVAIRSRITAWRRSSFDVEHQLRKGEVLAAEAFETRVWAGRHPDDPDAMKSRPIPPEVIDRFGR